MSLLRKAAARAAESTSAASERGRALSTASGFAGRSALLAPTEDVLDAAHQAAFDGIRTELAGLGRPLRGFQQAAVETAVRWRRVVLGYAPGLGKSAITLTSWNVLKRAGRPGALLVVCPPHLRVNWAESEVAKWTHFDVARVDGTKSAPLPDDVDVIVLPDSILSARLDDVLAAIEAGVVTGVAFDESQRYKAPKAARTKAAFRLAAALHRTDATAPLWSLTGTIVANGKPEDVYGPLCLGAGPEVLAGIDGARGTWDSEVGPRGWKSFRAVWSEGEWGYVPGRNQQVLVKVTGCKDPVRLNAQITSANYLWVDRYAVTDLEPVVWVPQTYEVNGNLREYRRIEADVVEWVKQQFGRERSESTARAEALVRLNYLDEQSALARTSTTVDAVLDLVEQNEQVVVFAQHTSAVWSLVDEFTKRGVRTAQIIGGLSPEEKAEQQRRYQSEEVEVIIVNLAAATGINLDSPRSRTVCFHQLPWSPATLVQAAGRVERLTQQRSCVCIVPLATDGGAPTLDARKWAVLQSKVGTVDAISSGSEVDTLERLVDDHDALSDSTLDAVLASFGWGA